MVVTKGLVFEIRSNKTQFKYMKQVVGSQRWIWNYFLGKNIKYHKKTGKFKFYNSMAFILTSLKQKEKFKWLSDMPSQTLQQTLKRLDKALKAKFKLGFGFPKFKSYGVSEDSACFPQGFKVERNRVFLPKVGWLKFQSRNKIHKKEINHITLKYDRLKNRFLISINFNEEVKELKKTSKSVGLDVGSVRFYTDSNGNWKKPLRELPKVIRFLERLELEQRKLSSIIERLKKDSKDRHLLYIKKKKVKTVGLIHRKLSDYIHNLLQKLTKRLVVENDLISVEDLKLKNMTKSAKGTIDNPGKNVRQKSGLNRNLLSNRLGMFFSLLEYKCLWYGKRFIRVNPVGTSQTCSSCGFKSKKNRKSQSRFVCGECGLRINADFNAALNILDRGLKVA